MKTIKNRIFIGIYVLISIIIFSSNAIAEENKNILVDFISNIDNFEAAFSQTLHNENGEKLETSLGHVYMQKPGKFRWIYQEPYTQLIITDSKTLWLYDADLEQVTIRDISESFQNNPASLILSGKEVIDEHFILINMGHIDEYQWIELTPRDIENQYSSIRLGFEGTMLGMMVLFDNLGQVTRIDFHEQKTDVVIKDELFRFAPPEGIDIIDDRDISGS